jgi:hypothetical protein
MARASALSLGLVVGAAACGGEASSPSGGVCLPVAPMQLIVPEGGGWEPVAQLGPDGVIVQGVNKRPGPAMRIAGDQLVRPTGELFATCAPDRTLRFGPTLALRFDAGDALVDPSTGQRSVYVYDTGEVDAGISGPARRMPWRVVGVSPATRRTAEVLVFAAMASIDWHVH